MENIISPTLEAIMEIKWAIGSGVSTKEALNSYLQSHHNGCAQELQKNWLHTQQGMACPPLKLPIRQALWTLIERGLAGQPILDSLASLESEADSVSQDQLNAHILALPFKSLLPLIFLQFPAYLILLLGPILRELSKNLGG